MKYLIIGLGNIGEEYANTRHNIGFSVLDAFAKASNLVFSPNRYGTTCEYKFKGRTLVLVKPSTYMNLSGKAVNYWLQKEKIAVENMLIIVDDLAIPFGAIRIKKKGGDAGHNGLSNIIQTLGHTNFNRMRFGISNDFGQGQQVNYVLSDWSGQEKEKLPERLDKMGDAIKSFCTIGIDRTMNYFNGQ